MINDQAVVSHVDTFVVCKRFTSILVIMFEYLLRPYDHNKSSESSFTSSLKVSSSISISSTLDSSRRSSFSSSRPEFRPLHPDIIQRNLVTDFLEATSLPVNVPLHRSKEAAQPSTPMREEFERCANELSHSLASKLISPPSYKLIELLGCRAEIEKVGEITGHEVDQEMKEKRRATDDSELIFKIEL